MMMGFLSENAAVLEFLADTAGATRVGIKLDGQHQAAAANLPHARRTNVLELRQEPLSDMSGIFDHAFLDQNFQRHARYCAGDWVATKGGTVFAWMQHAHRLGIGEHSGNRIKSTPQR